MIPADLF